MIIANGTIAVKLQRAGAYDPSTGYTIKAEESGYSEARPCQIVTTSRNQQAQHEGEAVIKTTLQVYIDGEPIVGELVRLCDKAGQVLGDYSVRWQEELQAVRQWRIHLSKNEDAWR